VAEDARAAEVAVVGIVVLDGVEYHRQARKLAPQHHGGLDAVQLAGQVHVHQHGLRWAFQAQGQGVFAALATGQHAHFAGGFQPGEQRLLQRGIVFDDENLKHGE
jgi:hypothetical protein